MFKKKPKQVEVIDMGGAKVVARKTSWIKKVKITFAVISVLWLGFVYWAPMYVKNHYSEPIKKSIVVSMFFDMQRYMQEQYEKMLKGIAGMIDLKKPVAYAVDKVMMAEGQVAKVEQVTAQANKTTDKVSKLSGIASKFGVNTGSVDNAVASANQAVAKVDDTAKMVNERLEKVKTELEKIAQTEIDKAMDEQIKAFLDKQSGGLGTTLLTNYGIKHVMPWKPSTWPITTKIYNDLEKSDVGIIRSLTSLVNKYFGYVAWGLVIAAWAAGLIIWFVVMGKVNGLTRPFLVCPRCGHTYADKRTGFMLLKVFQPWKWFM
ncbi:MAG: hypothetical protein LBJ18_02805 [Rickettsiales bacterium]|jgi:hypothetical protein|nr:hypothetical protein [Rickettsiales bacterium]